ncbi:MAG: hypothetical protein AAFV19_13155 [Pseudomonadota bacterium]
MKIFAAGLAAMAMTALAGCYQVPQSTKASYEQGRVTASDQSAGSAVLISTVGMPSTGWVVIHEDKGGQPDTSGSIGHAYVPAGPSENVSVPLDRPGKPGETVYAMLHLDTGVVRVYEFANGGNEPHDLPYLNDGKPVMTSFRLN